MTSSASPTASEAAKSARPPVATRPSTKPHAAAKPPTNSDMVGTVRVSSRAPGAEELPVVTSRGAVVGAGTRSSATLRGVAGTLAKRASTFAGQTNRQSMRSRRRRTIGLR